MRRCTRSLVLLMLPLPLTLQGCAADRIGARDEPTTGLTLSGPSGSLDALLHSAETTPHRWMVEKRWSNKDGSQAIRLRWPERPAPFDVGSIVWLTRAARANDLAITDTEVVETQPQPNVR